jgi:predicted metalloprotease with PDZ domain
VNNFEKDAPKRGSSTLAGARLSSPGAIALAAALSLPAAAGAQSLDTLEYHIAVVPRTRHLSVEGRLSGGESSPLVLSAPPASGSARTRVVALVATDDSGTILSVTRHAASFHITRPGSGAVRFRYRLEIRDTVPQGSTGAGMDGAHLYAVSRSIFVAPDPVSYRKTSRSYPTVRVRLSLPPGWRAVTGWPSEGEVLKPAGGEDLLGTIVSAGNDFRIYRDTVDGRDRVLAVRGRRYFTDSALAAVVDASLRRGARALGPLTLSSVTYASEVGLRGRTSGSLHGEATVGLVWQPGEVLELARAHDTFHETLHLWFGGALEAERWWTEGVTDYFAARLYSEWKGRPEDLAELCYQSYRNYLTIRHRTRLTMSQEARYNLPGDNTELLVYRKGMLAGLILDAAVRRGSGGRATLDHVARGMLARSGGRSSRRVSEEEIRASVLEAGGREAARAWERVVASAEPITERDLAAALREVTGRELPPPPAAGPAKELRPRPDTARTP